MSGSLFNLFYNGDASGASALLSKDGLQTDLTSAGHSHPSAGRLTRQDINKRDTYGRTVLHLAASQGSLKFVEALVDNQGTDINVLDPESGWSALHRALYSGNIACAQAIIASRGRDAIKVKDRESNSPFDVLNSTLNGTNPASIEQRGGGSDLFTFGSNKNRTLGFSDGNDRAYPEKVNISRAKESNNPFEKYKLLRVRDVQMAKFHTAVITDEPEINLFVCGFEGNSGRLGVPGETQFTFKPVTGFGCPVRAIALGQDHSVAVTENGEVFTWGSNKHGQLGYPLEPSGSKEPVQTTPRKIVSSLKRVDIIGLAASRIHSACFSSQDLYTWGLNQGQLGYQFSDEGPIQTIPRKVAILSSSIQMLAATERATACLLEDKNVIVFTNGAHFKVLFPLDPFCGDDSISQFAVFRPRHSSVPNFILKIVSGASTVCAISSMGDVFTFEITEALSGVKAQKLSKLVQPQRIWSLRKRHMAVRDIAVGLDDSVIISTESGHVWMRVKRVKPKAVRAGEPGKDYKFARVPNLTRVVAVRSNDAGAYAAIRSDVKLEPFELSRSYLADDLLSTLSFGQDLKKLTGENGNGEESGQSDEDLTASFTSLHPRQRINGIHLENIIKNWHDYTSNDMVANASYDLILEVENGAQWIYVHQTIFVARCPAFRQHLGGIIVKGISFQFVDGVMKLLLPETGLVAGITLVYYIYTDNLIDLTEKRSTEDVKHSPIHQLRSLASLLLLQNLSDALENSYYAAPEASLSKDLNKLFDFHTSASSPDVRLCFRDHEVSCHSLILCARSPFFDAMYDSGGLGGGWIASRRVEAQKLGHREVKVDLKHFDWSVMKIVLDFIYTDRGSELFHEVETITMEQFLQFVMDVMGAANELLLERLKDICQDVLRRFVNLRNVVAILEVADVYSADQLKQACLDYSCKNIEAMLENRLLDDLAPELIIELEAYVKRKQRERLPISRGDVLLNDLAARYPNLLDDIEEERSARQVTLLSTSSPSNHQFTGTPLKTSRKRSSRGATPMNDSSPTVRTSTGPDMIFNMDEELESSSIVRPKREDVARKISDESLQSPEQSANTSPLSTSNPWRDARGKPLMDHLPFLKAGEKFTITSSSVSAAEQPDNIWSTVKGGGRRISPFGSGMQPLSGLSHALSADVSQRRLSEGIDLTPQPMNKLSQKERRRQSSLINEERAVQHARFPIISNVKPSSIPITTPPSTPLVKPQGSPWKKIDLSSPNILSKKSSPQMEQGSPGQQQSSLSLQLSSSQSRVKVLSEPRTNSSSLSVNVPRSDSRLTPTQTVVPYVSGKEFTPTSSDFPTLGTSPYSPSPASSFSLIIHEQQTQANLLESLKSAPPRSLKDIQEEESFLRWWDAERKKVLENEARDREASQGANEAQLHHGRERSGEQGREQGRAKARGRGRGGGSEFRGKDDFKGRSKRTNVEHNRSLVENGTSTSS